MSYCPRCTRPLNTAGMCDNFGCMVRPQPYVADTVEDYKDACIATLTRRVEELEADNLHLRNCLQDAAKECGILKTELEAARAIVAKLPKTADGVPIVPGMHVWFYSRNSASQWVEELKVTGWEHLPGMEPGYMFVLSVCNEAGESDGVNLACCYSTEAAALAAKGVRDV